MKVVTIALGVFVPIYLQTHAGLRAIESRYVELAQTVDLSRWDFLRRVVFPGTLPYFLLGLRFAVTAAWLALVVVEQVNATSGIGYMMELARTYGQVDVILVGLVVYGLLGLVSDAAVRLLQRKALAWQVTMTGADPRRSTVDAPRSGGYGAQGRPQRRRPRHPARGVRGPAGPERLRQEHAAAGPGRPRRSGLGQRPDPGPGQGVGGLPGLPPAAVGRPGHQRHPGPAQQAGAHPGERGPGGGGAARAARRTGPTSCPAASSSASPWPARWSATPSCCWPTSPSAPWTPSPG